MNRAKPVLKFAAAVAVLWATAMLLGLPGWTADANGPRPADVLIRAATVCDGTGSAPARLDVAIAGNRIVAVGPKLQVPAKRQIAADGLVLAPGFIDLHTHSDRSITKPETRANLNYLTQGVTTIVTGNCGAGPTNVADYFCEIDRHGAGTNVIHLIPQGSLRSEVVGRQNRTATPQELTRMKQIVQREMEHGAWGMSTGLIYTPGSYASTQELIELAKVVARYGGIYASHIRGEGAGHLLTAVAEAIRIGREAGLPVHISHFKASGKTAWGMVHDSCRLVEQAQRSGLTVTADQYPYTASSTSLAAMLLSARDREGGRKALIKRLTDPEQGRELRKKMAATLKRRGGPGTIRIASFKKNPAWVGKSLAEIAQAQRRGPVDIAVEILKGGGASAVSFSMSEDDVRYVMRRPYVATASDGSARRPDQTRPHPRSYGCFPRKIGHYAIELGVLSLPAAVRSASGLPADILQLKDRGYIRPGYVADIVLFDPNSFRDRATFDQPHQYSTGVRYLFVNGVLTIDKGRYLDVLPGKALRASQWNRRFKCPPEAQGRHQKQARRRWENRRRQSSSVAASA